MSVASLWRVLFMSPASMNGINNAANDFRSTYRMHAACANHEINSYSQSVYRCVRFDSILIDTN